MGLEVSPGEGFDADGVVAVPVAPGAGGAPLAEGAGDTPEVDDAVGVDEPWPLAPAAPATIVWIWSW